MGCSVLSPCNSWWGWGTEVLKWHLLSLHLWSHWSHWRWKKKKCQVEKREPNISFYSWNNKRQNDNSNILDGDLRPLSIVRFKVHKNFQDGLGPVGAIGQKTKVRKWLLRCACLPFDFGQLVTWQTQTSQMMHTRGIQKMPKTIKYTDIYWTDSKSSLTELNEQFAVSSPLVWRQSQDAGYVIIFSWLFFLYTENKSNVSFWGPFIK